MSPASMWWSFTWLVASTAGCSKPHEATGSRDVEGVGGAATVAENMGSKAHVPQGGRASQPVMRHGLEWFDDAHEAAFRAASAADQLVLVDLWAPWCHTCLSMQSFVITAENLPGVSDAFVLLAVDTERDGNAPLLKELPVGVWPTFYIVEPKSRSVVARWLGAASPAQFRRFLADGERAAALERHRGAAGNEPLKLLGEADALATRGDFDAAARAYANALAGGGPSWPRRPETLVAQMTALWKAKRAEGCLELGATALGETGSSPSAVDFAYYALECASLAPAGDAKATALRRAVEGRLAPLCRHGSAELSPDDRADACDKLAAAERALGDTHAAREATLERLKVLESAAAGKPPAVALTYDWARNDALIQLDRAEDALALAQARERELPESYNPPHYQAKSYKALARWDDGLAAIERALKLAYGPRRAGLLTLKADLLFGAGRNGEAVVTLEQQLLAYRALPEGQKQVAAEARVERRLQEARAQTSAPGGSR